ncbi:MAG: ABC transporter permease [Candidatus Thermoplasmatota archaeon]|nr:ABC transporter permease [Candidatus Thermoplasmatota archaeon]
MARPKDKTVGELMDSDRRSRKELSELRRKRMQFRLYQFKKQWKIFYRSGYGKIGFYIIVIFAIIALLSPVLEIHHDALSYVAPSIDTTEAKILTSSSVGKPAAIGTTISPVAASTTDSLGSNMVYTVTSSGAVYAISLGSARSIKDNARVNLFNITVGQGQNVLGIRVFPLEGQSTSGIVQFSNYVMVATSGGQITLAQLIWSGGSPGVGSLVASNIQKYDTGLNFQMLPASSSFPVDTSVIPNIPFEEFSGIPGDYGTIFAVGFNATGTYLVKLSDVPLAQLWSQRISNTSAVNSLEFVGSYYQSKMAEMQSVIITWGSTIEAFNATTGNVRWSQHMPYTFTGKYSIPSAYQSTFNSYNSVFEVMNGNGSEYYVYGFYQSNGTDFRVFSSSSSISAISSSQGESGLPSSVLVISNFKGYLLSAPLTIAGNVSLSSSYGNYVSPPVFIPSLGSYIISSQNGIIYSLSDSLGKNPFNWESIYKEKSLVNLSKPSLLLDASSGEEAIAFAGSNGNVVVYSAAGVTINPMPPELHTPSGTTLLLGTNTEGNDVWSQFIASFPPDWVVGISVGLIGIAIALVLGMIIGYYRGFVSVALDTVTLVIYLIPGLALLIALTSVLSPSFFNIIWILSFLSWPFTTFTILGIIRSIKQRAFVEAAKVSGAGTLQILRRHMLPRDSPFLRSLTALNVSGAVGGIATLQFLGVAPLTILTWGAMLNPLENNFYLAASAPWWVIPPTVALTLFIMAFIFLSRGVDEVVNPRIRRR